MNSLFTPLLKEGLTTLKLRHDWRTGKTSIYAAKEWERDFDFSQYDKTFFNGSILTDDAIYLNTKETRALFEKHGLIDYLDNIISLLTEGRHFGMDCYFNQKFYIRFIGNLHSPVLGINNKTHAVFAGGIRRHGFGDEELEVIIDGLNLGRAMSFKNIAAELPHGGCKTTVHMDKLDLENLEIMGFLAYTLDSIKCFTGPDMNFPTEMADVMNKHFSLQYVGGPQGPLGETGKPTAYGTYLALKQAVKFRKGTERLDGLTVAVQGLGAVGWYMAELIASENVNLFITDINEERARNFISKYPGKSIKYVKPDEILGVEADILCPCAIGGILSDESIPALKFDIIFGPANNQLKASSQEEEIRLAGLLKDRGILFQEAWWHNTAGVLCGAEEYYYGANASYENLKKKIEQIVPVKTWNNLEQSKKLGITPTECMYRTCEELIYKQF